MRPTDYCAKLVLWDMDLMSKSERAQVAAWLRRQAMFLMKRDHTLDPLFTARYMKAPKRAK